MSVYDDLCATLDRVREHGNHAMARCPSHDDGSASLSLSRKQDRTLIHCFAGCTPEEILAAVGLSLRDLFDDADGYRREYTPMRPRPDHELVPSVAHLLDRMIREEELENDPVWLRRRAEDYARVGSTACDAIAEALRNKATLIETY